MITKIETGANIEAQCIHTMFDESGVDTALHGLVCYAFADIAVVRKVLGEYGLLLGTVLSRALDMGDEVTHNGVRIAGAIMGTVISQSGYLEYIVSWDDGELSVERAEDIGGEC